MANITYRISDDAANIPVASIIKGAPLTYVEVDANFKALNDELSMKASNSSVEASSAEAIEVAVESASADALAYAIALG